MRELKRGERLTGRRDRTRRRYGDYMASPQWRQRREAWLHEYREHNGDDPSCAICGQPWELKRDDLHHHDYSHLGSERFDDLVPLCRHDHDQVHSLLRSKNWRRHAHAAASRSVVARLRAARTNRLGPPASGSPTGVE